MTGNSVPQMILQEGLCWFSFMAMKNKHPSFQTQSILKTSGVSHSSISMFINERLNIEVCVLHNPKKTLLKSKSVLLCFSHQLSSQYKKPMYVTLHVHETVVTSKMPNVLPFHRLALNSVHILPSVLSLFNYLFENQT